MFAKALVGVWGDKNARCSPSLVWYLITSGVDKEHQQARGGGAGYKKKRGLPFIEPLLCTKHLLYDSDTCLIHYQHNSLGRQVISILQRRRVKPREVMRLTESHPAGK